MPTSARLAVTNSPRISVKNGAFCRVDVGIDPYTETGSAYVYAAAFRKKQPHLAGGQGIGTCKQTGTCIRFSLLFVLRNRRRCGMIN